MNEQLSNPTCGASCVASPRRPPLLIRDLIGRIEQLARRSDYNPASIARVDVRARYWAGYDLAELLAWDVGGRRRSLRTGPQQHCVEDIRRILEAAEDSRWLARVSVTDTVRGTSHEVYRPTATALAESVKDRPEALLAVLEARGWSFRLTAHGELKFTAPDWADASACYGVREQQHAIRRAIVERLARMEGLGA